ncbi:MAG: hypothetical protein GDA44_13850, partial [Prochloron sp. SP5CPC1]|nr:hypothetical protein [Candidatus Paraprochloron terpiosi SP5CPC1]
MERRKGKKKVRKGSKNIFAPVSWLVRWLLRTFHGFFLLRQSRAGFVIPTALMLLLVMSLVISSMLIRTSQRTQQVIGQRESQLIYNAATPAIERAKAKIEYLFKSDSGLSGSVPSEALLETLMLNEDDSANGITAKTDDPYTLPGETRLEIPTDDSGGYKEYNAWSFKQDTDGDGEKETIIYSILMKAEDVTFGDAYKQVTRNGPLGIYTAPAAGTGDCNLELVKPEKKGWYAVTGSSVRRNFQVNAVVVKGKDTPNPTVATLEYHQDRQIDKGNKWGAWFLHDLEIQPGPKFRFNGAMHSEGSIFVGRNLLHVPDQGFESFLISSPDSCIYSDDASAITITEKRDDNGDITYQGQFVAALPAFNNLTYGWSVIHDPEQNDLTIKPKKDTGEHNGDSLKDNDKENYNDLTLDPVALFTESKFKAKSDGGTNLVRDPDWNGINGRVVTKEVRQPFVDDTYRADNRWGPKPNYNEDNVVPSAAQYGEPIPNSEKDLITDAPNTGFVDVGLDGYWERRARGEGLRLIVGQRLELGNANGWEGSSDNANARDDDPLYPYNVKSAANAGAETTKNEHLQGRTLRDNLAAVQATAVYHHKENNGYFPVTVLASTSHPGTSTTWTN